MISQVCSSKPFRPHDRMAANPPGPGLLEHEPSVQMLTAFMSSSFGLQGFFITGDTPALGCAAGHVTCGHPLLIRCCLTASLTRYIVFMVRSRLAMAAWASGLRANCV